MANFLRVFAFLFLFTFLFLSPLPAQTREDCLMCHDQEILTSMDGSIHTKLSCVACHKGVEPQPHETKPAKVNCGICHASASDSYRNGVHAKGLKQGLESAPDCQDCHGTHDIRKTKDAQSVVSRVNLHLICGRCHPDATSDFARSVHGKLLIEQGMEESPTCSDCHASHQTTSLLDTRSSSSKSSLSQFCSNCHADVYQEYIQDVHGMALERGILRSATCTDCHAAHNILRKTDQKSTVYPANISKVTCTKCHLQERIVKQSGTTGKGTKAYRDPYHGVEVMAGDKRMPSCAACHGAHNIRPPSDPRSTVNPENLPAACGKCHPGAGPNFAKGSLHASQDEKGVSFIRSMYTLLIILIIGGMLFHNALDMLRHVVKKYKESTKGEILRFVLLERIQHIVTFATFTVLAYTGFVLKFPDLFLFSWIANSAAAMGMRALVHRIAGVIFIVLCFYNLYYMLLTARGREQLKAIFPVLEDLKQAIQNLLYKTRLSRNKPHFDRFDYGEKAEYWALVWGGLVMITTGLILWFPNFFLGFMPKWLLDVSKAIHFYEALLASSAIVVWHFYFVFFSPEVYPVNWGMLTGRITEEDLEEKHPAEYNRLREEGKIEEEWDKLP